MKAGLLTTCPTPSQTPTPFMPSPDNFIVKISDEVGQSWYRVYNPQTHQFQWFKTEAEVWNWLDGADEF